MIFYVKQKGNAAPNGPVWDAQVILMSTPARGKSLRSSTLTIRYHKNHKIDTVLPFYSTHSQAIPTAHRL
jgi:hypothetical protein